LSVWAEGFEAACKYFALQSLDECDSDGHEQVEECVLKALGHAEHVVSLTVCGEGACGGSVGIVRELNLSFFINLRELKVKGCSVDRLLCPASLAKLWLVAGSSVSSQSSSPAVRAHSIHLSGWAGSEADRVVSMADFERLANTLDTAVVHALSITHFAEENHGDFSAALLSRPLQQRDAWQSLQIVRITNTNLDCIPSSLNAARGLKELDLSDNALRTVDLSGLVACATLTVVSLARNHIIAFSTGDCPSLQRLVLRGNRLADLDAFSAAANQGRLGSLVSLDVSFNALERWTELCAVAASVVVRCPQFASIHFDGNPLCHKLPEADSRVFVAVAASCSSGQVSSLEVDGVRVAVEELEWGEIIRTVRDGLDSRVSRHPGVRTVAVQTPHRRLLKPAQHLNPASPAVEIPERPQTSRQPSAPGVPAVRAAPPVLECLRRSFPGLELGCVVTTENHSSEVLSQTWGIGAEGNSTAPIEIWLGCTMENYPVLDDYADRVLVRVDEQVVQEGSLFTVRLTHSPSLADTRLCCFGSPPILSAFVGCARAPAHPPDIALECIPLPGVGNEELRPIQVAVDVSSMVSGRVIRAGTSTTLRGGFVCPSEQEAAQLVEQLHSSFAAVCERSACLALPWPFRELLPRHRNWGNRESVAPASAAESRSSPVLVHGAMFGGAHFWTTVAVTDGELRVSPCKVLAEGATVSIDHTAPVVLSALGGTITTNHGPVSLFAASSVTAVSLIDQLSRTPASDTLNCPKASALALYGIGATAELAVESLNDAWACISVSTFGGIVVTPTDIDGGCAPIDVSGVVSGTMSPLFASKHPVLLIRFCSGENQEFLALQFASPEGCVLIADYVAELTQ
jgi:hypothetical protein